MSVFKINNNTSKDRNMFFDGQVDIARYDDVKYPQFDKLTDKQLGFFWRPEEVDILRDAKDFKDLTESEKHIFTANLKRQILLDSIQGRGPNLALLPIVSLPEIETWIETWTFSETIHSRSYTHIIRNIFPDPSVVFDGILDIEQITDCADSISQHYDHLMDMNAMSVTTKDRGFGSYKHKRALWMCLNAINALEGIRFYVSFACSWAFAELKKMEGNAKIIKLIARDENIHLASTISMLKLLPAEDKDFAKLQVECADEVLEMFEEVVVQEMEWADYLFKDGSMIGLNANVLKDYVQWIASKRCQAIRLPHTFKGGTNPLPWTQSWITGSSVQVAPQETEISSYIVGGVKKDVDDNTFKGFKL
jgi:ribonucleoside-diphosphate reductase beta chain